jgi:hypothetical protein
VEIGSVKRFRGVRALLALAVAAASFTIPLLANTASADALTYSDYDLVYEINDFSVRGNAAYPNSATLNCVDQKPGLSLAANHCTFKQALTQANGTSAKVLITVDATQLNNDFDAGCFRNGSTECGSAYGNKGNAPVIDLTKIEAKDLMCDGTTRKCGDYDAEDDRGAFEIYTSGSITVDFQGLLGIGTWEDGVTFYTTIGITSSNVKLLHINGLHSNETAIMIADGANNIEIGYGSTDANDATNSYPWSSRWRGWTLGHYSTERFLVIHGSHTNINLHDWAAGHIYDGTIYVDGYGIIFNDKSSVEGMQVSNYVVASGTSGSCTGSSAAGCTTSGIYAKGTVALTKLTITGMKVNASSGTRPPIVLAGADVKINTMTIKNSDFSALAAGSVMDFNSATVTGLEITGDKPSAGVYASKFATSTTTSKDYMFNFKSAKVTGLVISNSSFQGFVNSNPAITFDSATLNGVSIASNKFESMKSTSYGIIGFHAATQAAAATKAVSLDSNIFLGNTGAQAIVSLYRGIGLWFEFTGNTMDSNVTTSEDATTDPHYGGHLNLGRDGSTSYVFDTAHTSKVSGNTFINTSETTSKKQVAIFWDGSVDTDSRWTAAKNSNLQITGNSFTGYTGTGIYLHDTGGVRVQWNTFAASNAHAAKGSSHPYFVGEDTNPGSTPAHTAPRFLLNASYANKEAKAWNADPSASSVTYSQYKCSATARFQRSSSTVPLPYVIDVYASADEGVPGTPIYSLTVTNSTVSGQDFTFSLDEVRGKYLRTQVTSYADGVYQSSQFSTAAYIPNVACEQPDYTVTKTAYADAALTQRIAAGSAVKDGHDVYWQYAVTNNRADVAEPLIVTVDDDHHTDHHFICQVTLGPGETQTCSWHQEVHPERNPS